jgi:hypothetical protein
VTALQASGLDRQVWLRWDLTAQHASDLSRHTQVPIGGNLLAVRVQREEVSLRGHFSLSFLGFEDRRSLVDLGEAGQSRRESFRTRSVMFIEALQSS